MKNLSVLLVEDNEADIILTSELLNQLGVAVEINCVKDGEQAIHYISKLNEYKNAVTPDLVLLDINMPKIDGKEVLAFIKDHENTRSIHVIMYTSSTLESDMLFSYSHDVDLYLNKANSMLGYAKIIEVLKDYIKTFFKKIFE